MLLNLETDYAIRIVDCLASSGGRLCAETVSKVTGVPPRFTLKILRKLCAGGFAVSKKGAGGGYELARPAGEITLLDVIEAVNGKIAISRCQGAAEKCSYPCNPCKFKDVFDRVSSDARGEFGKINFGG